ncbi:MAG: hypothetical protein MRY64_04640 [Hyphomonadaceae bacterium]|nr:hypothetical protein [Hyphomonadaceae bacterium]
MRPSLIFFPLGALAACGSGLDSVHEAETVSFTPSANAVAAYSRFLGCPEEREDYARCHACDVSVHDKGEEGLVAYFSHWEHELKPWEGRDTLQVSISGEVADEKRTSPERSETAARALFEEGIAWCTVRGPGHDHSLKDEIDTVFGGSE